MGDNTLVSIIIPVREINDYIRESIPHILKMDYVNYEIIIFPDVPSGESFEKTRIIPTGKMGPAEKRDLALIHAKGEILAFLDDDAYPEPDWLSHVVDDLQDPDVAAVGGPAVTPSHDSIFQKASGLVFESLMGGGSCRYRYIPGKEKFFVDDFPTVNLIIRRDVFEQVGGFDTAYWPGEDTKLCLDIVHGLGKKILYDPNAVVYHHRRTVFKPHLKQISNYAVHRGFFVKKYPQTSLKIGYFIPSMFFVYLIISLLSSYQYPVVMVPLVIYAVILGLTMGDVVYRYGNLTLGLLTGTAIFLTHVFYGFHFLRGLFSGGLKQ
ncbi:MAG: glycosyltransferase [Methanolobus sp.]|nr:glycosyltransferase [Methanolobus sp.]